MSQIPAASDPRVENGQVQWFTLNESKQEIVRKLGPPRQTADFGADFESWQYQIGDVDHEEFSHQLVFRKSTGRLISLTRNWETEQIVDPLFAEKETRVYSYPKSGKPEYSVRVRRLTGGRVLIATGVSGPKQPTTQISLFDERELRFFLPWLAEQLDQSAKR